MSDELSNQDLERLKQRYKAIEAPPYLVTRLRAAAAETLRPRRRFHPAYAGVALAIVLLAGAPFINQQGPTSTVQPKLPSLSTLAQAMPEKPATSIPSLAQIKIRTPLRTPAKPNRKSVNEPHKYEDTTGQTFWQEETNNELS